MPNLPRPHGERFSPQRHNAVDGYEKLEALEMHPGGGNLQHHRPAAASADFAGVAAYILDMYAASAQLYMPPCRGNLPNCPPPPGPPMKPPGRAPKNGNPGIFMPPAG